MSVAFTKEGDTENAAATDLPDRPISPHPNLVTADGLAQLDTALAQARLDYAANQTSEAHEGDKRALARAARDLRYFAARRATARVMPAPTDCDVVRFGCKVTIARDDGRQQVFRLVGEDEAEPKSGTVSYVSPMAAALLGKSEGDRVKIGSAEVEIVAISRSSRSGNDGRRAIKKPRHVTFSVRSSASSARTTAWLALAGFGVFHAQPDH